VTVNPNAVKADSFARFDIRVPNERPAKATTRLTVQIPAGLIFVSFQTKPGWRRTVTTERLPKPLDLEGTKITTRVASVTWVATSVASRIKPGEFDEFGMSALVPKRRGLQLVFPSLQGYAGGELVRWIGAPSSDLPAPRVRLT